MCGTIFISHGFLTTMKNRNMPELARVPKEVLDDAMVVPQRALDLLDMYARRTTQRGCEPALSSSNDVSASCRKLLRAAVRA